MPNLQGLPVEIADGNIVTVPASLACMSTYVLLEQEDWFEKELPFVRDYLKPGMRVLDIGANYGVYSVGIGKAVGPTGRVWAFEPSHDTSCFLRHTLARNGLVQVVVDQCALSDRAGRGRLGVQAHPELNSLTHGPGESGEEVRVDTLDEAATRHGMHGIDFVKLDAEGEEDRIVAGGREFFRTEDPLVMFEFKHLQALNAQLLASFRAAGYGIFRLIGPSSLLVPVADATTLDIFELNLFACKQSRAESLEQMGLLLRAPPPILGGEPGVGLAFIGRQPFADRQRPVGMVSEPALMEALDAYAVWRQEGLSAQRRYGALLWALWRLETESKLATGVAVLSLLARVAHDAGSRHLAVQILAVMLDEAERSGLAIAEPTWPASEHYDSIPVNSDRGTWLVAATMEALISWGSYSAAFAGSSTLKFLNWLHASPYASARMERRRQLQQLQAGQIQAIQPSTILGNAGPGHRNAEFWRRAAEERTMMPSSLLQTIRA
jgi:FkbM family methyltransferase